MSKRRFHGTSPDERERWALKVKGVTRLARRDCHTTLNDLRAAVAMAL